MELVKRAARFAAERHGKDLDKAGLPVIRHPVRVMTALRKAGETDPEVLAAAVLHDVVEDTPTTLAEIEKEFGFRVAGLVKLLTRVEGETYFAHIHGIAGTGAEPIKIADITDNLTRPGAIAGMRRKYLKALRLLGVPV